MPVTRGAASIDAAHELTEIRKKLFESGIYAENAVLDVVVRCLRDLGVPEKDIDEVSGGVMGMQ